ncbi:MAG: DUF3466 family protein [Acidobacteria bacterium]|nr:DUF3466 family protein [Acidobacteriota bacterium]
MRIRFMFLLLIATACGAIGIPALLSQAQTTSKSAIVDLGTLGGFESKAFGINSLGQVVGYAENADNQYHAFLWQNGIMKDLGTVANLNESYAYAINDVGQVVGTATNLGSTTPHAFLWQNGTLTDIGIFNPRAINKAGEVVGTMSVKRNNTEWFDHACRWKNNTLTDLGTLSGDHSHAFSINDNGLIIGDSIFSSDGKPRAVLWQNGIANNLGTLGGGKGQAYALNNLGQIVGNADNASNATHGFLFKLNASGGVSERNDLGARSSPYSYAYAVNNKGQVVGTNGHAFLWQNGVMTDLNSLLPMGSDWVLTAATGINDSGQIVGWGIHNQVPHAFILGNVSALETANVQAANYSPTQLAPEAIASVFGTNLATTTASAASIPLPTTLAGTEVIVRDSAGKERLAPLFYVSPGQINYQIPVGTELGATTVTIISSDHSISFGTTVTAATAPGLFSVNSDGKGLAAAQVQRIRADGSQSVEPVARYDETLRKFVAAPIDFGASTDQVFLNLYGTGIRYRSNLANVTAKVGGTAASVQYAGTQGGYVGVDQINIAVPRSLVGRGEVEIQLTIDGQTANAVTIHIK